MFTPLISIQLLSLPLFLSDRRTAKLFPLGLIFKVFTLSRSSISLKLIGLKGVVDILMFALSYFSERSKETSAFNFISSASRYFIIILCFPVSSLRGDVLKSLNSPSFVFSKTFFPSTETMKGKLVLTFIFPSINLSVSR